jgi:hypothetical protein
MVVELWADKPVHGIIVEVQLSRNDDKHFAWPAYAAILRARLKCPVSLLVVATSDKVARWAAKPVELDGLNRFTPYVLRPSGVPKVTDENTARKNPELAVLSAMAHGCDADVAGAIKIATAAANACRSLDFEHSRIYLDLILSSLGEAARTALKKMDAQTYVFQSDFARGFIAQGRSEGIAQGRAEGRAEGEAHGRAALIIRQLTRRFGSLDATIENRIHRASIAELESIGERLLTAAALQDVLELSDAGANVKIIRSESRQG